MSPGNGQQDARLHALQAFEELRASMTDAAELFEREAGIASALLHALDVEPSITQLTARFPINDERTKLAAALDRYEISRRSARVALWRLMQSEGCSIGEISRIFGVSRQLVSRQLRDEPSTDSAVKGRQFADDSLGADGPVGAQRRGEDADSQLLERPAELDDLGADGVARERLQQH